MAHNPPRFEWLRRRPTVSDLHVNGRGVGHVDWVDNGGGRPFVGRVGPETLGPFADISTAQAAVEEEYRNRRWPAPAPPEHVQPDPDPPSTGLVVIVAPTADRARAYAKRHQFGLQPVIGTRCAILVASRRNAERIPSGTRPEQVVWLDPEHVDPFVEVAVHGRLYQRRSAHAGRSDAPAPRQSSETASRASAGERPPSRKTP